MPHQPFHCTMYIPLNPQPSSFILVSASLFPNASFPILVPLSLTYNFPSAFCSYIPFNPHPSPLILFCSPPHLSSLIPLPPSLSPYPYIVSRTLTPYSSPVIYLLSSLFPVPLPSLFLLISINLFFHPCPYHSYTVNSKPQPPHTV